VILLTFGQFFEYKDLKLRIPDMGLHGSKRGITTMPKKKKTTKTMNIARLKGVQKMGRDLELNLKVAQKDMKRMMDHIEHIAHGYKRPSRRRRP
jgi:hypothetical protein